MKGNRRIRIGHQQQTEFIMKNKFSFGPLKALKQKVDQIAGDVAFAESEILIAEANLEKARQDDGVIDPEFLLKKIDEADHLLRLRRIEANRIAVKLSETEEELHRELNQSVNQVADMLEAKIKCEIERLRTAIAPITGEYAVRNNVYFNDFIYWADAVSSRVELKDKIVSAWSSGMDLKKTGSRLTSLLMEAESML